MAYKEEKKNLEKFSQMLKKMKIPFKFKDLGNSGEIFPAIVCTYRNEDTDFDVVIYNIADWIHVKCLVLETTGLPTPVALSIYKLGLSLNYDLPETTFSLFNDNLYLEIDCLLDIDYDDFVGEFKSIPKGLKLFIHEIKQKEESIQISSTKGTIASTEGKIKK